MAKPWKLLTLIMVVEDFQSLITWTFIGFILIQCWLITNLRKLNFRLIKSHFLGQSRACFLENFEKLVINAPSVPILKVSMSSKYVITMRFPITCLRKWFTNLIQVLNVLLRPNGISYHSYSPNWVLNAIFPFISWSNPNMMVATSQVKFRN